MQKDPTTIPDEPPIGWSDRFGRELETKVDPVNTVRRKYTKDRPAVQFGDKRSAGRKASFVTVLAQGGTIRAACDAAGIARITAFRWKKEDAEFSSQWDDAIEEGTDVMEEEAMRRAVDGVHRPIYYQGSLVGTQLEYSDKLLEFMLKARRREKFGDKTELTGKGGGPIEFVRTIVDPKAGG